MATSIETKPQSAGRGNSMADEYRKRAAYCLDLSRQMSLTGDRAALIEMAQHWLELAQRAELEER